jgi:hypothetical protein
MIGGAALHRAACAAWTILTKGLRRRLAIAQGRMRRLALAIERREETERQKAEPEHEGSNLVVQRSHHLPQRMIRLSF